MTDEACLHCYKSPCVHLSVCNLTFLRDWYVELILDEPPGSPRLVSTVARPQAEPDELRGFSVAKAIPPLRLDVLSIVIGLEDDARDLVATVCRALDRTGPTLVEHAPARLRRRLVWLLNQLPAIEDDAALSTLVRKRTATMAAWLRRGVALHLPTGPLPYSCPLCDTEEKLLGDENQRTVTCPACGSGWSEDGDGIDSLLWLGRLLWRFAPAQEEELLLTTKAAAAAVGVHVDNVRDWDRSGHLVPVGQRKSESGTMTNIYRHADVLAARAATERETA